MAITKKTDSIAINEKSSGKLPPLPSILEIPLVVIVPFIFMQI
jgi:hypothetical protein